VALQCVTPVLTRRRSPNHRQECLGDLPEAIGVEAARGRVILKGVGTRFNKFRVDHLRRGPLSARAPPAAPASPSLARSARRGPLAGTGPQTHNARPSGLAGRMGQENGFVVNGRARTRIRNKTGIQRILPIRSARQRNCSSAGTLRPVGIIVCLWAKEKTHCPPMHLIAGSSRPAAYVSRLPRWFAEARPYSSIAAPSTSPLGGERMKWSIGGRHVSPRSGNPEGRARDERGRGRVARLCL
jgi:hypothetical protein